MSEPKSDPLLDKSGHNRAFADSPAYSAFVVTPSDSVVIAARCLWVGIAGDLTVEMHDETVITFTNITVGYHPLRVNRVLLTGTAAADIIGLN